MHLLQGDFPDNLPQIWLPSESLVFQDGSRLLLYVRRDIWAPTGSVLILRRSPSQNLYHDISFCHIALGVTGMCSSYTAVWPRPCFNGRAAAILEYPQWPVITVHTIIHICVHSLYSHIHSLTHPTEHMECSTYQEVCCRWSYISFANLILKPAYY